MVANKHPFECPPSCPECELEAALDSGEESHCVCGTPVNQDFRWRLHRQCRQVDELESL